MLVQAGGIATLYFASLFLLDPGHSVSKTERAIVNERWIEVDGRDTRSLFKRIVILVFTAESIGTIPLYLSFEFMGIEHPFYTAIFHAVSAFCNAGFSNLPDGIMPPDAAFGILMPISVLAFLGGLGIVVFIKMWDRVRGRMAALDFHTIVILIGSFSLLVVGTALYALVGERGDILSAFFHASNARTAGFQFGGWEAVTPSSRILSMVLMFIGGAPSSLTGGVKLTAMLIALLAALRGFSAGRDPVFMKHRITPVLERCAVTIVIRFILALTAAVLLLSVSESLFNGDRHHPLGFLIFESLSALSTGGLSTGITPFLSPAGKLVLILSMLTGRVGLLLMLARMGISLRRVGTTAGHIVYPEGEVFL